MHTAMMIGAGLILLGLFYAVARATGRGFLPVYLVTWAGAAAVNAWIGVTRVGYSLAAEAVVFLPVFGVPGLAAVLLARWGNPWR